MTIVSYIIGFGVEFLIETAFLAAALWIMIKLQKLNFNYLGLLGSAALASAIDVVLDNFIGIALTSIIVVAVLAICITKVTQAEHTDVMFTICVSFALTFGMNLWLMGLMMGDLRITAKTNAAIADAVAQATNNAALLETKAREEQARISFQQLAGSISLKGVTKSKTPLAMIQAGTKTHTLTLGESFVVATDKTNAVVTCKEIEDNKVILDVAGQTVTLSISPGRK